MEIELYEQEVEGLTLDGEVTRMEQDRRIELSEALGLTTHKRVTQEQRARAADRFPLLSGEDLTIWREYLPTRYDDREPGIMMIAPPRLAWYRFDAIPVSVLELWQTLKQEGAFANYEIWTPEKAPQAVTDPILAGYTSGGAGTTGPYLIARWGESLKPFADIKREIMERRRVVDASGISTINALADQIVRSTAIPEWSEPRQRSRRKIDEFLAARAQPRSK